MDREERAEALYHDGEDDVFLLSGSGKQNRQDREIARLRKQLNAPLDDFDALLDAMAQPDLAPPLRRALARHLQKQFPDALTERATELLHTRQPEMSALSPMGRWLRSTLIFIAVAIPVGFLISTTSTMTAILSVILAYCVASMALKGVLTVAAVMPSRHAPPPKSYETPVVTILLPVHDEDMTLVSLVTQLEQLDYPKDRLDLKFLVEENDAKTCKALKALHLPGQFEIIVIPESHPQTKPKAMNYALPFVRGEIVGIYDAEDEPEPDQIRKAVDALTAAGPETVCVQARLNHYNGTENILSRMAQAEYTLWFDILLKGLSRLGLPVPLGGTSLFIETSALRAIDGWDPNNVTEDADLGLRLARCGWRAEVIDSTTWEEPPVKLDQWTGQRSRWIKGFMVTWLVHMRAPRALIRDLGWRNALAINVMLLDGFVAFLLQPLFWVAILSWLTFGTAPWASLLSPTLATGIMWTFILGHACILLAALIALRRRFGISRAIWAPGLWVYWQFATRAAYRALREMFGSQSTWTKTEHGLSKAAQLRQQEALKLR